MKKQLLTALFVVTFFACASVSASAVENDMVKVGLRYGSSALFSANLENAQGSGYSFGYFDEDRNFEPLLETDETTISMTAAGDIYMSQSGSYSRDMPSGTFRYLGPWRVQVDGFADREEAEDAADDLDGWVAWISGEYVVRTGCYDSRSEAEDAAGDIDGGYAEKVSDTAVTVTVTGTTQILFEYDYQGILPLGVQPEGWGEEPITWFKGYRYRGGFEYPRITGGNLSVINVVDLEDYVKGVIPHEMSGQWPLAALEAQAVCARTYACRTTNNTLSHLQKGKPAKLYTHLNVREDAMELFGFSTENELNCFQLLTSVSGVGPKAALSILSAATPESLAMSIITGDEKALTVAQGIGKKIAQRIILELKDKLAKGQIAPGGESYGGTGVTVIPENKSSEAAAALAVLGYSQSEIAVALKGIDVDGLALEEIIKQALKRMVKN